MSEVAIGGPEPQETQPDSVNFLTLEFLYDVAGPYVDNLNTLTTLPPDVARKLANDFIDLYRLDFLWYAQRRDHRNRAIQRSEIGKRIVAEESPEAIVADYPGRHALAVKAALWGIATRLRTVERIHGLDLGKMTRQALQDAEIIPETFEEPSAAPESARIRARPSEAAAGFVTSSGLLESRDKHRQLLFGTSDGFASAEAGSERESLAALARRTDLGGRWSGENESKETINGHVAKILTMHDQLAHEKNNAGESLYALVDPQKDFRRLAALSARVIWLWDKASSRQGRDSPFEELCLTGDTIEDFARDDNQLVIETTAAVAEILQSGYRLPATTNTNEFRQMASFIAQQGPEFVKAWIRGDHIRSFCEENNLDTSFWLSFIDNDWRSYLATGSPGDPLAAFQRVTEKVSTDEIDRLLNSGIAYGRIRMAVRTQNNPVAYLTAKRETQRSGLTPRIIAREVGWSASDVKEFFTPGIINRITHGNADPLARIGEITRDYRHTLAVGNLMDRFDLNSRQAIILFPPSQRKNLAVNYTSPLSAADDLVALWAELTSQYADLSDSVCAQLAKKHKLDARNLATRLIAELPGRPPSMSANLWAHTILDNPNDDRNIWEQHANAYVKGYVQWLQDLRRMYRAAPLAAAGAQPAAENMRYAGDTATDPAEMLMPSDNFENLQALAAQADVSSEELGELLREIGRSGSTAAIEANGRLAPLLAKLRQAGKR